MSFLHRLLAVCALFIAGAAAPAPAPALAAPTTVYVVIDMRAEIRAGRFDIQRDRIGVRGSAAPLSWGRSVIAADADGDGRYEATLQFDQAPFGGQAVAYKFKIDRPDELNGGWEPGRNHPLLLRGPMQTLDRPFGAEAQQLPPERSGTIERLPPVRSAHVAPREVQVWLPPGYARDAPRRYPVLYLHDGQNVFDALSAGAEWQVDETAQRLVLAQAVAPMIVVAVSVSVSGTDSRSTDYTPSRVVSGTASPVGGGAAGYARYLVDELKPMIDARYRTKPQPTHTAVGGSSLGGLLTMWLLRHHADTFGAGLVVSPSVWWDHAMILADVASLPAAANKPRVWLDIGLLEGDEAVRDARRLRDVLQTHGWAPVYTEQAGGGHDEASWASRVEAMLNFLYSAQPAQDSPKGKR